MKFNSEEIRLIEKKLKQKLSQLESRSVLQEKPGNDDNVGVTFDSCSISTIEEFFSIFNYFSNHGRQF